MPPTRRSRVAVFGQRGSHRTEASVLRAVHALGHRGRLIDPGWWRRRLGALAAPALRRLVSSWAPDVVILTRYAAELDDETLAAVVRGRYTALWFFDLVQQPHRRIVRLGRAADVMYVTCPEQRELYRSSGVGKVLFLPQAADPAVDRPARRAPARFRCDASFVGSGQYPYRYEVLREVGAVCRLQIRGPGWDDAPRDLPVAGRTVRGRRFAQVVRGAAVSLGALAFPEQIEQRACASNRMWKVMGCGGFYLGQRVPGIERLAADGVHCGWYDTPDDAVRLLRDLLPRPEAREAIARAGRAHTLAEHTYAHRLRLLLDGREYPVP